jgi:hypothetical protein
VSTGPDSILDSLGQARRFADPNAPTKARMMAARGTLPLPPDGIASVLFALTFDPDPEVQARAAQSLEELPDRVVDTALEAALHPSLLDFFARKFREDETRLERIALNSATSDETFCFLATLPLSRLVDIAANNQIRLMRCPAIFEALGENPVTGQATIDRILEFLGVPEDKPEEETEPASEEVEDLGELPDALVTEAPDADTDATSEETDEQSANLFALIQNMKVIDKVRLARFGNKEARSLLMRDRNRIVATAAIRSPKITDNEVIAAAQSRSVSDDVLRVISNTREWTRIYQVQLALTTNPKAPLASAIKFLNYLTDRDLRAIMRSRDVPGPVAQQARRILARKGKS